MQQHEDGIKRIHLCSIKGKQEKKKEHPDIMGEKKSDRKMGQISWFYWVKKKVLFPCFSPSSPISQFRENVRIDKMKLLPKAIHHVEQ